MLMYLPIILGNANNNNAYILRRRREEEEKRRKENERNIQSNKYNKDKKI